MKDASEWLIEITAAYERQGEGLALLREAMKAKKEAAELRLSALAPLVEAVGKALRSRGRNQDYGERMHDVQRAFDALQNPAAPDVTPEAWDGLPKATGSSLAETVAGRRSTPEPPTDRDRRIVAAAEILREHDRNKHAFQVGFTVTPMERSFIDQIKAAVDFPKSADELFGSMADDCAADASEQLQVPAVAPLSELERAAAALLDAPMMTPEYCFNSSHQGPTEEDCSECERETQDRRILDAARQAVRDALQKRDGEPSYGKEGDPTFHPKDTLLRYAAALDKTTEWHLVTRHIEGAVRHIDSLEEKARTLESELASERTAVTTANALIGEAADEAKRLQDRIDGEAGRTEAAERAAFERGARKMRAEASDRASVKLLPVHEAMPLPTYEPASAPSMYRCTKHGGYGFAFDCIECDANATLGEKGTSSKT